MLRPEPAPLPACTDRNRARKAIAVLRGNARRSADTHLVNPVFPGLKGISIYLKNESTHPTGSLKHRLARSLVLYGICNGRIRRGTGFESEEGCRQHSAVTEFIC